MLKELKRDDDSTQSHRALGTPVAAIQGCLHARNRN